MEIFQVRAPERIKPLWEQLNRLHLERSEHFKDHFSAFTFEDRIKEFETRDKVMIFGAGREGEDPLSGYCIASVKEGMGEVDSLFLLPDCRGEGAGGMLMEKAMAWLARAGCEKIRVSVARGNEAAFGFYEKFGFNPRFTVLELRREL